MRDDSIAEGIPEAGILVANQGVIESLQKAVLNAPRDIETLRLALSGAIRDGAWMDRLDTKRRARWRYEQGQFLKFVTDPLPEGLGTDVETLEKFIREDVELYEMFLAMTTRGPGGANNPGGRNQHTEEEVNRDNVTVDLLERTESQEPPRGNTLPYAIRRLAKDRPDLLERVKAGEMSAHAAMVEAGFRKVPSPLDVLKRAWGKAAPSERKAFSEWIFTPEAGA